MTQRVNKITNVLHSSILNNQPNNYTIIKSLLKKKFNDSVWGQTKYIADYRIGSSSILVELTSNKICTHSQRTKINKLFIPVLYKLDKNIKNL